jgi:HEAT repeat protein
MTDTTSNPFLLSKKVVKGRTSAGMLLLAAAIALSGANTTRADRFPEDPVELFKEALIVESAYRLNLQSRISLAKDAATRKELEATYKTVVEAHRKRMEAAAKALTSLADLSRALFLLEWPARSFDREQDAWAQIDERIRDEMLKRLVEETVEGLEHGSPARQIALLNLTAENLVTAEDPSQEFGPVIVNALAKLQAPIERLFKNTKNDDVRVAAAVALGRFVRQADKVGPALGTVLADRERYSERSRRAAADALVSLVLHLTGEDVIRASEPGVTPRETRRTRLRPQPPPPPTPGKPRAEEGKDKKQLERTSYRSTLGVLASAVTAAAAQGATDPAPSVRSTSLSALRQAAAATAYELRLMKDEARQLIDRYLTEYTASARDRERAWTEWERKQAQEERADLEAGLAGLRPALKAFTSKDVYSALSAALRDPDQHTRLEARRSLDELSRLRRFLSEYDNQIPLKGKEPAKEKEKDKLRGAGPKRHPAESAIVLVAGTSGPLSTPTPPIIRVPPPPQRVNFVLVRRQKKAEDDLTNMLLELGEEIVRQGLNDPNPIARRATAEAVEALGPAGVRFTPRLVEALKDPDLFVRWIAARALEKLAYTVEKEAPKQAAAIVAGLACVLDDSDLDPRTQAASALGAYGPVAKSAVPALIRKLAKGDPDFRIAVIKGIEGIGTDGAPALGALANLFTDPDQRIRAESARVVGRFGAKAKPFVPGLERLVEDPDLDVRKAATAALIQITPLPTR